MSVASHKLVINGLLVNVLIICNVIKQIRHTNGCCMCLRNGNKFQVPMFNIPILYIKIKLLNSLENLIFV